MKKYLKKVLVCVAAATLAVGGIGAMPAAAVAHAQTESPQYDNRVVVIADLSIEGDTVNFSARAMSLDEITSVTMRVNCEKTTYEGEFVRRKPAKNTSTLLPVIASGTMQAEKGYVYTVYATADVTFADGTKASYTDTKSQSY